MPEHSDDLDARVEALVRAMGQMETRVARLEEHDAQIFGIELPPQARAVGPADALVRPKPSEGGLALTGRTLVALGGGYLIRAMTDAGLLPGMGVVGLGLAYSAFWIAWGERSAAAGLKASASFHGIASALIAYPLLWETTTRFGLLEPGHALAILVLVFAATMALAVHRGLTPLAWITTCMAVGTTAALFAATHQLLGGLLALAAIAAAIEFLAFRGQWLGLRWPAALLLDAELVILVIIASDPAGLPRGYPPLPLGWAIAAALAVPAIYLAGVVARTLGRGLAVLSFEVTQATAALVLGFGGAWKLSGSQGTVATALGAANIMLGALCYAAAFAFVERRTGRCRNFYFYSSTGGVLALAGSWVVFRQGGALTMVCSLLALASAWAGCRFDRLTLRFHSACYLCAAMVSSGLAAASWADFFAPAAAAWQLPAATAWAAAISAIACYAVFCNGGRSEARLWEHLPRGVASWAGAWVLGGTLVAALVLALRTLAVLSPAVIATLRTAVLALMILAAGWATRRWALRELAWLAYALLAAGGLKLLTEDLRQGNAATLFLSLVFYGGALFFAPRLIKAEQKQIATDAHG